MPKLDPYSLPRPARESERRSFMLDGETHPLTLTLRRLSYPEDVAAQEEAREFVSTYITGNDVRGAAPFPDPDVTPSATFFLTVCRLARMQCPADPADRYETMELMHLSILQPRNFEALVAWANTLGWGDEQRPGEF